MKFKKYYTDTDQLTQFPALIQASGEPLVDYTIYGNTGGVAARTANYFDKNNITIVELYPNQDTGVATESTTALSIVIPIDFTSNGNLWMATTTLNRMRIAGYTSFPTSGSTATFVDNSATTETGYRINPFIAPENTNYIMVFLTSAQGYTETTLRELLQSIEVMCSQGAIKQDYVPYYCIPVSSGGVTTNLYIDTPLGLTDTLTYTDTGIAIPTFDGDNTITFGTTIQPSGMSAEFKGWHSQDTVRVYNGSQWE